MRPNPHAEWLEADGLGGFASGTAGLVRTRRYHALLLAASPGGRFVLVNDLEAAIRTPGGTFFLSAQAYAPDVFHSDGPSLLARFDVDPWPRWRFKLPGGGTLDHEILVVRDRALVLVSWRLSQPRPGMTLRVRPLLSGRDLHALHRENGAFRFAPEERDDTLLFHPYVGVPSIAMRASGPFTPEPLWYRNVLYAEEKARGFDHIEDLASPGRFDLDLSSGEAALLLAAPPGDGAAAFTTREALPGHEAAPVRDALTVLRDFRAREKYRRDGFRSRLERAGESYVVRRGGRASIIAGYPWFADWGRDTFIALRGLCLATGRLDEAREILLGWAAHLADGLLPNRFPDGDGTPFYNSADAALWFVVVSEEWRRAMAAAGRQVVLSDDAYLRAAVDAILSAYEHGTRHAIHMDDDGLVAAGEPGESLTWMDARVGGLAVTSRVGKPVELQALWINALAAGEAVSAGDTRRSHWADIRRRGTASFVARFWNQASGCLHDVVDVDGRSGENDPTIRPNQIFAAGGLPVAVLDAAPAAAVVAVVERRLLTPVGLRTLDPADPAYHGRYEGGPAERDAAYHQGTVWPWLLGPFVEAWVRARGGTPAAKREARHRFLEPLAPHLEAAGLDHLPEIADGDAPHAPRGAPFQAWSVGEALRLSLDILATRAATPKPARLRRLVKAARAVESKTRRRASKKQG